MQMFNQQRRKCEAWREECARIAAGAGVSRKARGIIVSTGQRGTVVEILRVPAFPRPEPGTRLPDLIPPRMIGYIQLGLLCLMIFLYVGFRVYYAKKYGDFETDEE